MKLIISLVVVFLMGCATSSPNHDWQGEGYRRQLDTLMQKHGSGGLSLGQVNRQMIAVSSSFFPGDQLLFDFWVDLTYLGEQVDRNELTREKYEELADVRTNIYAAAHQQRGQQARLAQAQERRSLFIGNFLGNLGGAMQRSNPPPITCSTTSMPGVLTTSCR